jgi:hypothetical protein
MTRLRDIYGPGFTQAEYLRALAAGYETGWWDDNGVPAPWPDDFHEPTAATTPAQNPDRTETNHPSDQETEGSADTPPQGT